MSSNRDNSISGLQSRIQESRIEWRKVRENRLKRKEELKSLGFDKNKIRREKLYKQLKKEQDNLSKTMNLAKYLLRTSI